MHVMFPQNPWTVVQVLEQFGNQITRAITTTYRTRGIVARLAEEEETAGSNPTQQTDQ